MVETHKTETRPSTNGKGPFAEVISAGNLAEAQKRGAAFLSQANELMTKASRAFWEEQNELFRLEAEQVSKALSAPKPGENLAATVAGYCDQQHERAERMIAQMRRSSDLLRDYGWQFLALYSDSFKQGPQA